MSGPIAADAGPTVEALEQAIATALGPTWDSAVELHLTDAALAVRALLPTRPSVETIRNLLHDTACGDRCDSTAMALQARQAEAVLARWPGRPEAEVQAEALDYAAAVLQHDMADLLDPRILKPTIPTWLRARAKRIRAGEW